MNEEIQTALSDTGDIGEQEAVMQRGRPRKYDTEHKNKLTLYLTAEMFTFIKTAASVKSISMTDYAVSILEQELAKKKGVLEQLLKLQESL